MKKRIIALLLCSTAFFSGNALAGTTFTDINNSYAKTEIQKLGEFNLINGDGNGLFRPYDNITREEFAKMLVTVTGLTLDANASSKYSDVSDWARPYVGALVNRGWTSGISETQFGAKLYLTRG